jgi:RPA family protein
MEKKRITTTKTRINVITSGQYFKQEGFEPNYVLTTAGQKISRVRVLATVVDKFVSESGKFAAVTADDGTDTIRVKIFNAVSMFDDINVGDIVDFIGRVKEYNGEVYIAPEIITKSEPNMEILRELEIRHNNGEMKKVRDIVMQYKNQTTDVAELNRIMKERFGIDSDVVESVLQTKDAPSEETGSSKDNILHLIEKLDTGVGCDYSELLEASKIPEETMDSIINELLSDGVCFEPKPGKIKKL